LHRVDRSRRAVEFDALAACVMAGEGNKSIALRHAEQSQPRSQLIKLPDGRLVLTGGNNGCHPGKGIS
jgi:hypothetical protein